MKKVFISAILLLAVYGSKAQDHQPPSPEEHLKKTTEVFQKELQLNENQFQKVQQAYKHFMEEAKTLHDQNPPPPPPPMNLKVKEQFDKLITERDSRIKEALTDQQYQKYLEVEKKMRPPHPGEYPQPPPAVNK